MSHDTSLYPRPHTSHCTHPDRNHDGRCPAQWPSTALVPVVQPEDPWAAPAHSVGLFDFHGVQVPILMDERGRWVHVHRLSTGMGVDAEAQRMSILRNAWSEGWTFVTKVQVPGDNQRRSHFWLHEKRVPMWLATVTASRIADENTRRRIEQTQREFADVLAEWSATGEVKPKTSDVSDQVVTRSSAQLSNRELAMMVIAEADRADREREAREIAEAEVRAHEGGSDITLTKFYKAYFTDVMEREFFEHLYSAGYLIDQRGKGPERKDKTRGDGPEHRHPTRMGKQYIQLVKQIDRRGRTRWNSRVRPDRLLAFKAALVADGLPANNQDGIVAWDEIVELDEFEGED